MKTPAYFIAALALLLLLGCSSTPPSIPPETETILPAPATPTPPPRQPSPEEIAQAEAARRHAEITQGKAAVARDPKNWRVFGELGQIYYRQGMYDPAISSFQQALALHSITTIIEAEQQQEAVQAAQRAAIEAKRQAEIQRAKELQSKKQMNEIFGLISSVAGMQGNSQAQMLISTMENVNNQIQAPSIAVPPLSPALKTESSLKAKNEVATLYSWLGAAYFGKKDYQQTIEALDSAMQLDPSRTETLKTTAEAQFFLCRYDECIETLARYHAIAPVDRDTLLRLSDAYRALGMTAQSDGAFAAFLARQSNGIDSNAAKQMELGAHCLAHWRYTEALPYLQQAQNIAAGSPDQARHLAATTAKYYGNAHLFPLLLAEALSNLEQHQEAIALLSEATTHEPVNPRAWYLLARCFDETGASDRAAHAYSKALAAFATGAGRDALPAHYIVVCRAATGQGDAAIQQEEHRLATVPLTPGEGVDAWCNLALAYEKAGRLPEAIELLNRCHDTAPAYTKARTTLVRLDQQTTRTRQQILDAYTAANKSGNKALAIEKLAEAYRLMASGPEKETVRKTLLATAARMTPAPGLTARAQDHYLRGNVALKNARSTPDLGRALSEFQWAVFHAPWDASLYFSTSAVKKLENRTAAAVNDLKLYLAGQNSAENVDEILNRLYEFDYQHEQKLRDLAALTTF